MKRCKKNDQVAKEPQAKKLDASVMKALGFVATWPAGNPQEPWWEHKGLDQTFFCAPTAEQLFYHIVEYAKEQGRAEVRDAIRSALQV